jgi:hypothetical protein
MHKRSFEISSYQNPAGFETVRWHTLNYVLRQGTVSMRSPLSEGRTRPSVENEEFAVVSYDQGVYYFFVEPMKKGQDRRLQIIVESNDQEDLAKRALQLTARTDLIESNAISSH